MKTKRIWLVVSVLLVLGLLIGGPACSPPALTPKPGTPTTPPATAAPEKPGVIHWSVATSWPGGTDGLAILTEYWAKQVQKLSEGRIVIDKVYKAGELFGAGEVVGATASGKVQVGSSSVTLIMGDLPAINVLTGARMSPIKDPLELQMWYWQGGGVDFFNEYLQTKFNVQSFPYVLIEAEGFWTKKPLKTPADVKGLKFRGGGTFNNALWEKFGASAVTLPMVEVVPALQKGVLDGADLSVPYIDFPYGIYKVAPYNMQGVVHQGTASSELFINLDVWKALPADLKAAVIDAVKMTQGYGFTDMVPLNINLAKKMVAEGAIFYEQTPEMRAALIKATDEVAVDFVKKYPEATKFLDSQTAWHKHYLTYRGKLFGFYKEVDDK